MIDNIYQLKQNFSEQGICFCYSGPFSYETMIQCADNIKSKLESLLVSQTTINKVFSVFIEQCENIIRYSDEKLVVDSKSLSSGIIVLGKMENEFFIASGNLIEKEKARRLREKIELIRKMDKNDLKEHYKTKRKQNTDQESKGAGIGLIEIARKVSEPIQYKIENIDEKHSFFSIKSIVS